MTDLATTHLPDAAALEQILLPDTDALSASIGATLGAHLGDRRVDVGPAGVQTSIADLVPPTGLHGVVTSISGGGAHKVVVVVDDTLRELLERTDSAPAPTPDGIDPTQVWLASVSETLEDWARNVSSTMDSALAVEDAAQLAHLVPMTPELLLVGAGLFMDGRHVGSVGVVASVPPVADSMSAADVGAGVSGLSPARPATAGPGSRHTTSSADSARVSSLQMLADVEMHVTAELGRTRMNVAELLALGAGSVIELDRTAGSPIDLLVNGTLIARGEVVVVDEEYGVRLTEIVGSPDA